MDGKTVLGSPAYVLSSQNAGEVGAIASGLYSDQQGYLISYASGSSATIDKRPVTVNIDNKSKTYGDANPTLTYTVAADGIGTSRGLVAGDSLSGALSTPATRSSGANSYAIDASALANGNYLVTANNGTLTINKAHLSLTADNKTKIYGDSNPPLTTTLTGFVNGESLATSGVTGSGRASTSATTRTGAGSAAITAELGTLAAANYDVVTFTDGALTITPRPVSVAVDNKTKAYGDANPALTYTVAADGTGSSRGLVNGDNLGSLSTTATVFSTEGNYTIDASTLSNGNYLITAVNGTLSIQRFNVYRIASPLAYADSLANSIGGFSTQSQVFTSIGTPREATLRGDGVRVPEGAL
jgi:hypothetical protein